MKTSKQLRAELLKLEKRVSDKHDEISKHHKDLVYAHPNLIISKDCHVDKWDDVLERYVYRPDILWEHRPYHCTSIDMYFEDITMIQECLKNPKYWNGIYLNNHSDELPEKIWTTDNQNQDYL